MSRWIVFDEDTADQVAEQAGGECELWSSEDDPAITALHMAATSHEPSLALIPSGKKNVVLALQITELARVTRAAQPAQPQPERVEPALTGTPEAEVPVETAASVEVPAATAAASPETAQPEAAPTLETTVPVAQEVAPEQPVESVWPEPIAEIPPVPPESSQPAQSKQPELEPEEVHLSSVATGFLGLTDSVVADDEPEPKKKWWQKLIS